MPIEFLTEAQVAADGRVPGAPTRAQLERFFFLDDVDRQRIDRLLAGAAPVCCTADERCGRERRSDETMAGGWGDHAPPHRGGLMGGRLLNLALRLHLLYFLAEVLRRRDDPRFAGKALPVRNALIVGGASLVFPALHLLRRPRGRWRRYPVWLDSLYLSIFWLDMAGNSFDLYDRYSYFDLLPHAHGTGAATVVAQAVLGLPALSAVGVATVLHLLLEAQEYYTDVLFGTRNVRGVSDTVNDLLAGLAGTGLYSAAYARLAARRPAP